MSLPESVARLERRRAALLVALLDHFRLHARPVGAEKASNPAKLVLLHRRPATGVEGVSLALAGQVCAVDVVSASG